MSDKDRERREFGSLRLRGKIWYIRYRIDGKEHWESSGSTSKRTAEKLLDQRQAELRIGAFTPPDAKRVALKDLRQMVADDYKVKGRRSLRTVKQCFARLEKFFGNPRAVAITTDRITAYERDLLDEGYARATINKDLAALRRAFNLAVRARRLPLSAKPAISTPNPKNARQGFFEWDDFQLVLDELPEPLKPFMLFAYYTGWRSGEIKGLKWENVDFDAGVVRLEPNTTKNDEGRTFPFDALPDLRDLLTEQRKRTLQLGRIVPWVFHRNGRPIKSYDTAWQSARKRAATEEINGRKVVTRPYLLDRKVHDFRRTAVRNLERAGVPRSIAMQLTGHKTESVYRRYDVVNEADLGDGVAKLAAHLKGTIGGQAASEAGSRS